MGKKGTANAHTRRCAGGRSNVVACSLCRKKKDTAAYLPFPNLLTNDVWRSDSQLCCQPHDIQLVQEHTLKEARGRGGQIITSKIYAHIYAICWEASEQKCANICIQHTVTQKIKLLSTDDCMMCHPAQKRLFCLQCRKTSSRCQTTEMWPDNFCTHLETQIFNSFVLILTKKSAVEE